MAESVPTAVFGQQQQQPQSVQTFQAQPQQQAGSAFAGKAGEHTLQPCSLLLAVLPP
jgi:hypothetical protein